MSKRKPSPAKTLKNALLPALVDAGIASVEIDYDGEGDSGQVNGITAYTAANVALPSERMLDQCLLDAKSRPTSLEAIIDDFVWDILDIYHGGFENNDGGYGTITIDVPSAKVAIDHNDRITDVVNTTTEA